MSVCLRSSTRNTTTLSVCLSATIVNITVVCLALACDSAIFTVCNLNTTRKRCLCLFPVCLGVQVYALSVIWVQQNINLFTIFFFHDSTEGDRRKPTPKGDGRRTSGSRGMQWKLLLA